MNHLSTETLAKHAHNLMLLAIAELPRAKIIEALGRDDYRSADAFLLRAAVTGDLDSLHAGLACSLLFMEWAG